MHAILRFVVAATVAGALAGQIAAASESRCEARSGATRVALLELYTSEGCDSCPPAERWLNALPARGLGFDKVVPLAWHVDYWNHLGWTDRFAQPRFTQRQRAAAERNRRSFVYTPQRLLNGRDFRPSMFKDATAERVAEINRRPPGAEIRIAMTRTIDRIHADLRIRQLQAEPQSAADVYLVLMESALETAVKAGENQGKRLQHDFVVRTLVGPLALSSGLQQFKQSLTVPPDWRMDRMSLAAFVEHRGTGDVIQALALAICP